MSAFPDGNKGVDIARSPPNNRRTPYRPACVSSRGNWGAREPGIRCLRTACGRKGRSRENEMSSMDRRYRFAAHFSWRAESRDRIRSTVPVKKETASKSRIKRGHSLAARQAWRFETIALAPRLCALAFRRVCSGQQSSYVAAFRKPIGTLCSIYAPPWFCGRGEESKNVGE